MEQAERLDSFVDYGQDEGFVPLAELEDKLDDEEREVLDGFGYAPAPEPFPERNEDDEPATPADKIERLLSSMIPHRLTLVGILDACEQPASFEAVEAYVRERTANRGTVFDAATYSRMLVEAGALEKVTKDGVPYDEVDLAPVEVERDGRRFLQPVEPPEEYWRTTDAGAEAAAQWRPQDVLRELFKSKEQFAPVFERILEMCDRPGGASINEIKAQVNGDPILLGARKTAQFLIDYLDRAGALTYEKAWVTTVHGKEALGALRAKED